MFAFKFFHIIWNIVFLKWAYIQTPSIFTRHYIVKWQKSIAFHFLPSPSLMLRANFAQLATINKTNCNINSRRDYKRHSLKCSLSTELKSHIEADSYCRRLEPSFLFQHVALHIIIVVVQRFVNTHFINTNKKSNRSPQHLSEIRSDFVVS